MVNEHSAIICSLKYTVFGEADICPSRVQCAAGLLLLWTLWSSHSKGQGLGVEEGAKNHERSRQAACARSESGRDKQSRGREGSGRT